MNNINLSAISVKEYLNIYSNRSSRFWLKGKGKNKKNIPLMKLSAKVIGITKWIEQHQFY